MAFVKSALAASISFFALLVVPSSGDERQVVYIPRIAPKPERPLGNPENAVRAFHKVYLAFIAFRTKYHRLPEMKEVLEAPDGALWKLSIEDFRVPDLPGERSEIPTPANVAQFLLSYLTPRPDGAAKPAFPKDGEKDAWLACDVYTRHIKKRGPDGKVETKLEGDYVVLWSDGTTEKIPLGRVVWFPEKAGSVNYVMDFPGQTGLPSNVISEEQMAENSPPPRP